MSSLFRSCTGSPSASGKFHVPARFVCPGRSPTSHTPGPRERGAHCPSARTCLPPRGDPDAGRPAPRLTRPDLLSRRRGLLAAPALTVNAANGRTGAPALTVNAANGRTGAAGPAWRGPPASRASPQAAAHSVLIVPLPFPGVHRRLRDAPQGLRLAGARQGRRRRLSEASGRLGPDPGRIQPFCLHPRAAEVTGRDTFAAVDPWSSWRQAGRGSRDLAVLGCECGGPSPRLARGPPGPLTCCPEMSLLGPAAMTLAWLLLWVGREVEEGAWLA
ncbi:uncharacterized protein [Oryctolagus cuniculus]|uniref:uncharacterized protein n=1 Tax=Oryctolagus cuniculus TaxID=9986 RepID=UPI00387A374A